MATDLYPRPWSGSACRHIPDDAQYSVLDLRMAGSGSDNRWNSRREPTLYLAGDSGVAIAEFARHYREDRTPVMGRRAVRRRIYTMQVRLDHLLDLRTPEAWDALSLTGMPYRFLDKDEARAVAGYVRNTTAAQSILVPSMAFLEDLSRWVLVVFLEKLPADPSTFLTNVEADGVFHVEP